MSGECGKGWGVIRLELTGREYRLLKRISKKPLREDEIKGKDMEALHHLVALGYVERSSLHPGNDGINKPGKMLNNDPYEKGQDRYKHIQYGNLVLKSFLAFFLGLMVCFIIKLL